MAFASKITIEIGGTKLNDFLSLGLSQSMFGPHDFQLVVRRDAFEQQDDSPLQKAVDKIGAVITILIEGVNSGVNTSDLYFKGIITEVSTRESTHNQQIIFKGQSPDTLLEGFPACRSFENMTLKQIAEEVVNPYPSDLINLRSNPDDTNQYPFLVQYKETNRQFLRRLSEAFGEWLFYDGRNFIFGSFQKDKIKGTLGINVTDLDLKAKMAAVGFEHINYNYGNYTVYGVRSDQYDISGELNAIGKKVYDQSKKSFPESPHFYFPNVIAKDDGTVVKKTTSITEREKQAIGTRMVTLAGSSHEILKIGNVLQVKTLNETGNRETDAGDYLITGLRHTIDNTMNYHNNFTAIPAESAITPNAAVNSMAVSETQFAQVIDNKDPDKMGRVKVRFFWQLSNQSSPWLRIAQPHAGKETGFHFLPEINEEVVVGFEGGNPQRPFVMGSMFSSNSKPDKGWESNNNDFKVIRSRSGHTIEFNDSQGNEMLTIYNPTKDSESNKIVLSMNPASISIYSKGDISFESGGDIKLKASNKISLKTDSGDITVDAGQAVKLSGTSGMSIDGTPNVDISGTNVSIKADGQLKAEGAMAELNGSATVQIQGAMVKIN